MSTLKKNRIKILQNVTVRSDKSDSGISFQKSSFLDEDPVFSDSEEEREYADRVFGPLRSKGRKRKREDVGVQCNMGMEKLDLPEIVSICANFDPDHNENFREMIRLCKRLAGKTTDAKGKDRSSSNSIQNWKINNFMNNSTVPDADMCLPDEASQDEDLLENLNRLMRTPENVQKVNDKPTTSNHFSDSTESLHLNNGMPNYTTPPEQFEDSDSEDERCSIERKLAKLHGLYEKSSIYSSVTEVSTKRSRSRGVNKEAEQQIRSSSDHNNRHFDSEKETVKLKPNEKEKRRLNKSLVLDNDFEGIKLPDKNISNRNESISGKGRFSANETRENPKKAFVSPLKVDAFNKRAKTLTSKIHTNLPRRSERASRPVANHYSGNSFYCDYVEDKHVGCQIKKKAARSLARNWMNPNKTFHCGLENKPKKDLPVFSSFQHQFKLRRLYSPTSWLASEEFALSAIPDPKSKRMTK